MCYRTLTYVLESTGNSGKVKVLFSVVTRGGARLLSTFRVHKIIGHRPNEADLVLRFHHRSRSTVADHLGGKVGCWGGKDDGPACAKMGRPAQR